MLANSGEAQEILRRPSPNTRWTSGGTGWPTFPANGASSRTPSNCAVDPQKRGQRLRPGLLDGYRGALPAFAAPAQFGGEPAPTTGRPINEHGDAILKELGLDWDTIVDLKVRSVVG